jgi:anti-sigma regulatory factor (Ser/Thr protein kinase)
MASRVIPRKVLEMSYPAAPSSVASARASVAALAEANGASHERADAVRLSVSEAVSNAVEHAYRVGGDVRVTAIILGGELLVVVEDGGRGIAQHRSRLGLGLALIAEYSDSWMLATPSRGGVQIEMRFDLDLPSVCYSLAA